jgi:hypothetical protein
MDKRFIIGGIVFKNCRKGNEKALKDVWHKTCDVGKNNAVLHCTQTRIVTHLLTYPRGVC